MDKYIILGFLILQVAYSWYAYAKLKRLSLLIPLRDSLSVGEGQEVLAKAAAEEDLDSAASLVVDSNVHEPAHGDAADPLPRAPARDRGADRPHIAHGAAISPDFLAIIQDLNEYALKNRGSASDFAIVKDVVDRPVDAQIARAEARTSTPLYLGLAGALTGIVVGLAKMSQSVGLRVNLNEGEEASDAMSALTDNLGELLGSVSFAMIASLLGVLLTIALSLLTRRAVATVDKLRNDFFTFYQIEFLPRISRDVNSVLSSLNGTLDKFNDQFGGNVQAMQVSFTQNKSAIQEQQRVLEAMRQLSVGGALEGTVTLYRQVTEATESLEKLVPHIERVHYLMKQVGDSGERFASMTGRVEQLTHIAENMSELTRISQENQRFVARHMEVLQSGSGEALSVTQSIVESFERSQGRLEERLLQLTAALQGVVQTLHTTAQDVVHEANASLSLVPNQLEPLMREAFSTQTVQAIKASAQDAATAAEAAGRELNQSKQLRGEVETGLQAQATTLKQITSTLHSLQRRNDANSEALQHLLGRRPWWWLLPSKRKPVPPALPKSPSSAE